MFTIVSTPIGNLEDISYRGLETIKNSSIILCEDSRVTKKLLLLLSSKFQISFGEKEIIFINSHNEEKFVATLTPQFFDNNIIYLSDAGVPCISDPGSKIVEYCHKNRVLIDIIPGASAVISAYAMSGFYEKEFLFYGFLVHSKEQRVKELNKLLSSEFNIIIFESPKRVQQLLEEIFNIDNKRELFLIKEITKLHQKYFKDSVGNLIDKLKHENLNGEWVVVVKGVQKEFNYLTIDDILSVEMPKKSAAKLIAKITSENPKAVYQKLI
ncbi:MAG: 16S rRNA (cytidine(1402)-2'-O)-methyltransferase [Campylobacterales bacterium]|nr:16S rRNA (cytidine(1402)-2'-O)-methyltransferase [Campylobacterales bacterium]